MAHKDQKRNRKREAVDAPSTIIKPMVVDLSHWDPCEDYSKMKAAGYVGVIYKATESDDYQDPTYVDQQHAAKEAGLKWGCYHFADSSDVAAQVNNFMTFACPDADELFCLDWEDNGGDTMTVTQAKEWIALVEAALDRPGECVIYSGNTAKELLGGKIDPFFSQRRLWLAQYGTPPKPQASWQTYWLWQYTDGSAGPDPHTVDGVGACDINSYSDTAEQLEMEWASGSEEPQPTPEEVPVNISIDVPESVALTIEVNGEIISSTV